MSDLNRQQERIVRNAQRAGLRMSHRVGHAPSQEELMRLRVQVAPAWTRWVSLFASIGLGVESYFFFTSDSIGWGIALAILSFLSLLFSIFGIRKTLEGILDGMSQADGLQVIGQIFEGIFDVLGSLGD